MIWVALLVMMWAVWVPTAGMAQRCDECMPRVALKSNLVHDALLVPDVGVEVEFARRFSVSTEVVWSRWGGDASNWCQRVAGGWLDLNWWFGDRSRMRALMGHHAGVFGGVHRYDFCFSAGKGVQSVVPAWSCGVSYGYSFRLRRRLNLDVGMRVGYLESRYRHYRAECGLLVAEHEGIRRYFGPLDLSVTLVWFPGKGHRNLPDYSDF